MAPGETDLGVRVEFDDEDPPRLCDDPTTPAALREDLALLSDSVETPTERAWDAAIDRVAYEVLTHPLTEAVTRTIPILHDPRVCVLCGVMNAPRVGVALTPDPVIVVREDHPACRRVLAPGTPLCAGCYRATVTV